MGVHDTHPGQLLAGQRRTEPTTADTACGFCGTPLGDGTGGERVEHVLPAGADGESRTEEYCSPSCFVRQMERVGAIE